MDPQIIDSKYQIISQLGHGGMGIVYEARNLETGRRVAVKVIVSEVVARSPDATIRFKREAKAAGAIETQHVAQVLDAGRDPTTGDPYMVMELLSGEDLKQLIRRTGPLAPDLALRITAQACVGLQAAHDAGIIHRDIKPANLYLARREGGEVVMKIVDFGIAKVVADQASSGEAADLTRTGAVLGSPRYMSPEQAKGLGGVGPRSDLWSLGIVLYEMLTGKTPHAEVDGTFGIIMAICSTPAPPVCECATWVSPECAAVVEKALQIDPERRFTSATEMLSALRALLPDGTSIHESMLVPLSAELKATESVSSTGARRSGPLSNSAIAGGETALNLTGGAPVARVAPRRFLGPALALSLLLGGGGFAAYKLGGSTAAVAPAGNAEPMPTVSATVTASTSVLERPPASPPKTCSDRMVLIPGGSFQMGSKAGVGNDDERPERSQTVANFCLDQTEVTSGAYRACVNKKACTEPDIGAHCNWGVAGRNDHPINCVDWTQAKVFCEWAQKRLPSEREWEYAARGPQGRAYPWGESAPGTQLCWNRWAGKEGTCKVGSYPAGATPQGAQDLAGNVWEWVEDIYCKPYLSTNCPSDVNAARVFRGGSWVYSDPSQFRGANRHGDAPSVRSINVGFRCAL
jgi:serine/threonine-protein kinase